MRVISTQQRLPAVGTVDVWLSDVAAFASEGPLSAAERERAARRVGAARVEFVAAHVELRRILAPYLNVASTDVEVVCPYGEKPHVPGSHVHFSLSHRDGRALFAVSCAPVGVDIERADVFPDEQVNGVADFILTSSENRELEATKPGERSRLLARFWSRKEATLKLLGYGLGDMSLNEVETAIALAGRPTRPATYLRDIDVGPGFVAAIASSTPISRIALRDSRDRR